MPPRSGCSPNTSDKDTAAPLRRLLQVKYNFKLNVWSCGFKVFRSSVSPLSGTQYFSSNRRSTAQFAAFNKFSNHRAICRPHRSPIECSTALSFRGADLQPHRISLSGTNSATPSATKTALPTRRPNSLTAPSSQPSSKPIRHPTLQPVRCPSSQPSTIPEAPVNST